MTVVIGAIAERPFYYDVRDYGGKIDVVFGSDGVIVNGTKDFTSATATFTANDVGKIIWVDGLVRTIATFVSATHVTVNANMTFSSGSLPYCYGTDNSAAITSALAALPTQGGTILVPGNMLTSTQIDVHGTMGRHFRGVGGQVNPSVIRGGQLTSGAYVNPSSSIIYTGTAGPFLNATDCVDFAITDLSILYANTLFTGSTADLVLIGGTNGTTPAIFSTFTRVNLSGIQAGAAVLDEANSVLNLCGAVWFTANACNFAGAQNVVVGLDPNRVAKGLAGFSNAITFNACVFTNGTVSLVLNPFYTWSFYGCTFEPPASSIAKGVVFNVAATSILFSGCGFWDATVSGGVWTVPQGDRISYRDCYFENSGVNSTCIDASQHTNTNMIIDGCQFDNINPGTATALAIKGPAGGSGNTLSVWMVANSFVRGCSDPVATLKALGTVTLIAAAV